MPTVPPFSKSYLLLCFISNINYLTIATQETGHTSQSEAITFLGAGIGAGVAIVLLFLLVAVVVVWWMKTKKLKRR